MFSRRTVLKVTLTLSLLVTVGCFGATNTASTDATDFRKVLSSPETYDGKEVTLRAWISMRHEDYNLWLTWKDHEDWQVRNCISLINFFSAPELRKAVDGKYVEIKGVFQMDADTNAKGKVIRLGSCNKFGLKFEGQDSIKILERN